MWHANRDRYHLSCDMWHVVGGEHLDTPLLSDRGDTWSTLATWLYKQQDLEEKGKWLNEVMN